MADRWEKIAVIANPLATGRERLEDGLAMLFGNLVTLMLGMLIGLLIVGEGERQSVAERVFFISLAAGWLLLDVPYLVRLWHVAFRGNHPWALETAKRQRLMPVPMRPIIALWWLAHFACGAWFSLSSTLMFSPDERLPVAALSLFMGFCYGVATNGYLIIGVCALTTSQSIREACWRWRFLLDLALGVGGALLPAAWVAELFH
jgi:hypothetical protein